MSIIQRSGGLVSEEMAEENFVGSDCFGSDGDTNRILTTFRVDNAKGEILLFVDGTFLRKTDEYTTSGNDITLLIKIWNEQKIDVRYIQ